MAKRMRTRIRRTHIDGLDEVKKMFEDMGDAAAEVLDKATKEGAELVFNKAKQKVPVDSGKLRDSLVLKKSKVKNPTVRSEYYVSKKSGAEHFAPVELGTSKMKAQPFLRPAIDENMQAVAKTVNDSVLKAIGRTT
ncbi:MAG TPA: hypothetical protein DIW17_05665 [Clostridiales bacterium]|nr:hypothetical protein [Clostridiales bacterium]